MKRNIERFRNVMKTDISYIFVDFERRNQYIVLSNSMVATHVVVFKCMVREGIHLTFLSLIFEPN